MAYWEECQRVGPLQQISNSYVHILQSAKLSETNNLIEQPATLPLYSSPPSTSSHTVSGNTFSKPSSATPLSKTCDQYSNLNIIEPDTGASGDKILMSSTLSDTAPVSSMKGCRLVCSKFPPSVISEKKSSTEGAKDSTDLKVGNDEDSNKLFLAPMFHSNPSPSHSTSRTRCKIGNGKNYSLFKTINHFHYLV